MASSTPASGAVSPGVSRSEATALVTGVPWQVRVNLTGMVLPSLNRLLPSVLIGCRTSLNALPYLSATYERVAEEWLVAKSSACASYVEVPSPSWPGAVHESPTVDGFTPDNASVGANVGRAGTLHTS